MAESPVDIVRRLLGYPANPDIVHALVAEDSVYVSLNFEDPHLKRIMPCLPWKARGRVPSHACGRPRWTGAAGSPGHP